MLFLLLSLLFTLVLYAQKASRPALKLIFVSDCSFFNLAHKTKHSQSLIGIIYMIKLQKLSTLCVLIRSKHSAQLSSNHKVSTAYL